MAGKKSVKNIFLLYTCDRHIMLLPLLLVQTLIVGDFAIENPFSWKVVSFVGF